MRYGLLRSVLVIEDRTGAVHLRPPFPSQSESINNVLRQFGGALLFRAANGLRFRDTQPADLQPRTFPSTALEDRRQEDLAKLVGGGMGSHRTTIKRKRPLTHISAKGVKRREAIKSLHVELKGSSSKGNSATVPLAVYQQASAKGQDIHRGGDSSKALVQWLKNSRIENPRVLEVGCLEVDNAIAKHVNSHQGSIRRIDLKSRDPRIEEQDFMTLDVPDEVSLLQTSLTVEIRSDFVVVGIEFCTYPTRSI
jgi:hypothetical protein